MRTKLENIFFSVFCPSWTFPRKSATVSDSGDAACERTPAMGGMGSIRASGSRSTPGGQALLCSLHERTGGRKEEKKTQGGEGFRFFYHRNWIFLLMKVHFWIQGKVWK